MTIYASLETLLRDMVGFMRAAPDVEILAADDPGRGLLGYCAVLDPHIAWEIPIATVAGGSVPEYVRQALRSRAGRVGLVAQLRTMAHHDVLTPAQLEDLRFRWMRGDAGGARVELRPMAVPEPEGPPESPPIVCWDFLDDKPV